MGHFWKASLECHHCTNFLSLLMELKLCVLNFIVIQMLHLFCSCFPADLTASQLDVYWTSLSSGQQFQFSTEEWNSSTTSSNDSVLLYACPHCTKRYKFRTSLYRHLKFECGKEPSFHCPHCSYMTKQKAPMQRHIRNTHGINT
jgi:uncharacterized C2H2 Zn-finger protein